MNENPFRPGGAGYENKDLHAQGFPEEKIEEVEKPVVERVQEIGETKLAPNEVFAAVGRYTFSDFKSKNLENIEIHEGKQGYAELVSLLEKSEEEMEESDYEKIGDLVGLLPSRSVIEGSVEKVDETETSEKPVEESNLGENIDLEDVPEDKSEDPRSLRSALDLALENEETAAMRFRKEKHGVEEALSQKENDLYHGLSSEKYIEAKDNPENKNKDFRPLKKLRETEEKIEAKRKIEKAQERRRVEKEKNREKGEKKHSKGTERFEKKDEQQDGRSLEQVVEQGSTQQAEQNPESQVEKKEKSTLDTSRERYASADRKVKRLEKLVRSGSVDSRQLEQALEERAQAETQYMKSNQERQAEFVRSLDGQGAGVKREALKGMLFDTTIKEADRLYDLKTNLALEEKGVGLGEKVRERLVNAERAYANLPRKTKLLIAGGMLAGAGAAALLSGPVALGIAGVVGTARIARKALLGASVATATEALAKGVQEKSANKRIEQKFGSKILESFEKGDVELYNALYKLESGKARKKAERYALAGTLGTLAATLPFGKIASDAFGESGLFETIKEKIQGIRPAEVPQASSGGVGGFAPGMIDDFGLNENLNIKDEAVVFDEIKKESAAVASAEESVEAREVLEESFEHIVAPGENMYSVIKEAIPEISTLPEAGQWNAVENILAEIKESPTAFGIESGDVNLLSVGDKIDLEAIREVFETETIKGESFFDHAAKIAGVENLTIEDEFSAEPVADISEEINAEETGAESATPEEIRESPEQEPVLNPEEKSFDEITEQNDSEGIAEEVELSELVETYKKLDIVFGGLTAEDVVRTESGGAENFTGTLPGGEEGVLRKNSFNNLLRLVMNKEITSDNFVSYFAEKGIVLNEQVLARDFGLLSDPSRLSLARPVANRLEMTFNSLVVKLSS